MQGNAMRRSLSDQALAALSAEELAEEVAYHNRRYWDDHAPEITDYDYDRLVRRLTETAPGAAVLQSMGPTVGGRFGQPVEHALPMLSLDKCYRDDDLRAWAAKFSGMTLAMPKLDGIAASLRYDQSGRLALAATRGDGVQGDDITANALAIRKIPRAIDLRQVEIRGEIYMKLSVFARFADEFSNPRNLAAGAIKQKDPSKSADYGLSFMAYDLIGAGIASEAEKLQRLVGLGFPPVEHRLVDADHLREAYEYFAARRAELDFEIDGVVFKTDRVDEQERLSSTAHHPRYAIAYKFQGESGTTTLRDVEWSVARTGAITPVAIIEPITLSGAQVARASLHNLGYIDKLALSLGARIAVTRRGGVIPHVEFVVEKGDRPVPPPGACPSCGGLVTREGDFLFCLRPAGCRDAIIGAIAHYCAVVDIQGFGDKLLREGHDKGILRSPADLYRLDEAQLLQLDRVGRKLASKLVEEVNAHRELKLSTFLRALGIQELGKHMSAILEQRYQTLSDVSAATVGELAAIHTVGDVIAAAVVAGLEEKRSLIDSLLREVSVVERAQVNPGAPGAPALGPLAHQSFVFTGKLITFERKAAQQRVNALGGDTPSGVSQTLTYLVVGAGKTGEKSSKERKADKINADGGSVAIISEEEFLALLKRVDA
jgi:DNA ligase (NAD+)